MLKETETEETISFVATFLSFEVFQLGGPGSPGSHSGYPYALSVALKLHELQQMSSRSVVREN